MLNKNLHDNNVFIIFEGYYSLVYILLCVL